MSIDSGQISALSVVQRLERELRGGDAEQLPIDGDASCRAQSRTTRRSAGVYVEGLDDVMIHLARCCSPVPGDPIMGFITQGRGVSVHRDDCSNAVALAQRLGERVIDVEWDGSLERPVPRGARGAGLRPLAPAARRLQGRRRVPPQHHLGRARRRRARASCAWSSTSSSPTRRTSSSLLAALKRVDGVFDAFRQLPGQTRVLMSDASRRSARPSGPTTSSRPRRRAGRA